VEHVDERKVKALQEALSALREDRDAFQRDPKAVVPDLDDDAAAVFSELSGLEVECLLLTDERMSQAGFEVASGEYSARMV
jgi:hypothetical protein